MDAVPVGRGGTGAREDTRPERGGLGRQRW